MDNIRFIAMFCVILGHLLELLFNEKSINFIYRVIYSFHMPLFIFLSGYFAKFNRIKILYSLTFPYIVFQTLYLIFDNLLIKNNNGFSIQYTTPYFHLWYLLALTFYYLLIPFFNVSNKKRIGIIIAAFVLSLVVGFESTIGYYFSLSRFMVFLPYFLCGYYSSKSNWLTQKLNSIGSSHILRLCVILGIIFSCVYIYIYRWKQHSIFYG